MSEPLRKWDAPFLEHTLRARLQNFLTRRTPNPWALDRKHQYYVRPSTSTSICSDPEPRSLSEKLLLQNTVLWSVFSPGEVYGKVLGQGIGFQQLFPGWLLSFPDWCTWSAIWKTRLLLLLSHPCFAGRNSTQNLLMVSGTGLQLWKSMLSAFAPQEAFTTCNLQASRTYGFQFP